ncbi:protein kinase [Angomonas deanei]|nr:protein kinase [Angomonas deanei]|eukprot:EPY41350.1 protein kinase [Angomonas deanei]
MAERKNRFIAVVLKGPDRNVLYPTLFGTVLGYSDDDTQIIWQNRAEKFASRIPLSAINTIHRAMALQCRHCGFVLLRNEIKEHTNTHKKGLGKVYGVFTDDSDLGTACGDTLLIQRVYDAKRLGEGAQGVVDLYQVEQPTSDGEVIMSEHFGKPLTKVVVKTLTFKDSTEALENYQQSVRFLTGMCHAHLVEYLAVSLSPNQRQLKLFMPFYQEGDLAEEIKRFTGKCFPEEHVCSIALQLSQAISFLHERNPPIVHGDIKMENVMMYNNKAQIVLMDLDASREVRSHRNVVESNVGTAAYMAPETMNKERLMPASDMWSLGVLLHVLMVLPDYPGMILNPNTNDFEMFNSENWATPDDLAAIDRFINLTNAGASVSSRRLSKRASLTKMSLGDCVRESIRRRGYSRELTELVVDLLSHNPTTRPTATDVEGRVIEIMTAALLSP